MVDGIINNGSKQTEPVKQAPPPKDKKPSVLAKLRQYQQEDRKNDAMHFCAERDI